MELGVLSLLPIVVFFVLVFTTKRMVTSFVVGILLASILTSGTGFVSAFLGFIQSAFTGGTLGYLFLLLALFGILIMLLDESGAALGFANWVSRFANTKRKTLLLSLVVGVATFVDDYLHEMAVGSAMKPVTDKFHISRSKLAVLNNATAATVCVMIPLSTWGAFYAGMYESTEICEAGQGLSAYISSLPYMFFPIIMILLMVLLCLGILPDIGALKKSEQLAQTEGIVCAAEIHNDHKELRCSEDGAQAEAANANPIPFILSIVVIVAITMILGDVCIGCCGAIVMMYAIILFQKQMTIGKLLDVSTEGIKSMFGVCLIIVVALAFTDANNAIGMSDFIVNAVTPILKSSASMYPAMVFAFLGIYSFFAGGAWTQSMIFMPVFMPIAFAIGANPLLVGAACVSASAASSSYYIGADAVLLTSASTEVTPKAYIDALFPYAGIAYILSTAAYVVAGLIL